MTVIEVLLRGIGVLHALDPAALAARPGATVTALGLGWLGVAGLTVVGVAALAAVLLVLWLATGPTAAGATGVPRASRQGADLVTRIAWSDPDADGHVRSRAPGAVPAV